MTRSSACNKKNKRLQLLQMFGYIYFLNNFVRFTLSLHSYQPLLQRACIIVGDLRKSEQLRVLLSFSPLAFRFSVCCAPEATNFYLVRRIFRKLHLHTFSCTSSHVSISLAILLASKVYKIITRGFRKFRSLESKSVEIHSCV